MDSFKTFEELKCWQSCNELKEYLRKEVLPKFPGFEKYDLYMQVLRASRSATANIAEGWGRYHYKENIKFLLNARGSVAEILDHALEAHQCNYIDQDAVKEIRKRTTECIKLINGFIRFLRTKNESQNT
ncbi:four helix bundle protein [Pararhodonellum marinum]|uniref:four helix bundle protein n=1 Tax=Pararhodonellum marinum TaxID=2755358 RepID=UPI00188FD32B|nr:four helix bundle protein [Pararhodonellum marinum]